MLAPKWSSNSTKASLLLDCVHRSCVSELPVGNSPEFSSLLPDLLAALMPNIISKGLPISHLGDLNTLKDLLDQELYSQNSFACYSP